MQTVLSLTILHVCIYTSILSISYVCMLHLYSHFTKQCQIHNMESLLCHCKKGTLSNYAHVISNNVRHIT